jgi:predicted PolB exonuclease-like 3'-5' exonuclease
MAVGVESTADGGQAAAGPAYLIMDTESVPDGRLLVQTKYPGENLTPEQAIERAQAEARERSRDGSDFLPVSFQYPVAVCIARIGSDYRLQSMTALDSPQFRPKEIVAQFWRGMSHYGRAKLVTYNGRGFDLPLLELAAFRYGISAKDYFKGARRDRYNGHIDLMDWLSNFGACRFPGGLNLLSKLLGKPGKMDVTGDQVYAMYQAGKKQEINDYCVCDVLDTYFVFLRSRVICGEMSLEKEQELIARGKEWIAARGSEQPALQQYLAGWGDWQPWP